MTRHALLLSALLFFASPAAAGGPAIFYAKGGSTSELISANADGTGTRSLYKAPQRKKIFGLAVRPGGNELAFEEVDCCSSGSGTLKIIEYNDEGVRTAVRSKDVGCRISSLDYHPTNGSLLMASCRGNLSLVDTDTFAASDVVTGRKVSKASWASETKVFIAGSPSLWTFEISAPTALTKVADEDAVQYLDAAADGSIGMISVVDPGASIKLVPSLTANAGATTIGSGSSPSLSPAADWFAYITRDNRGQYIRVRPVSSASGERTIAGKSSYSAVAWADTNTITASQTDFGIRTP